MQENLKKFFSGKYLRLMKADLEFNIKFGSEDVRIHCVVYYNMFL